MASQDEATEAAATGGPATEHGRRRTVLVIAIVAAVVVVASLLGLWLVNRGSEDSPQQAVSDTLSRIKDGDTRGAYEALCADSKAQMTQADFDRELDATRDEIGSLQSFEIGDVFEFSGGANVEFTIVTSKAGESDREVSVENADGTWRVCGLRSGKAVAQ